MDNLINEFNINSSLCVDFILSVTNDSDLQFYKKAMNKIIETDKSKIIEQFIIHCLPHYRQIMDKDEQYFIKLETSNVKLNETSLIEVLKLRKYFISLEEDAKNLIFEYLILLCNYSKEYLQIKLNLNN